MKEINPLGNSKPSGCAAAGDRPFFAADDGPLRPGGVGTLFDTPDHLYLPAILR